MAAMTMPVRPVRVRAGIVEGTLYCANAALPAPHPPSTSVHARRLHSDGSNYTNVMLAFRYFGYRCIRACYTEITLNTSVVWCDGSGAVFDLRTPAFSFPSVRLQRNQN
jgi:hypothetical protein